MKHAVSLLLVLTLFFAAAESVSPDEGIVELVGFLCSLPDLTSFEEAPDGSLAKEAVRLYPAYFLGSELEEDAIYAALFANPQQEISEEASESGEEDAPALIPTLVEIEDALTMPGGEIRVSAIAKQDFGSGYEFAFLVDLYFTPDKSAPHGYRVSKIFFPE